MGRDWKPEGLSESKGGPGARSLERERLLAAAARRDSEGAFNLRWGVCERWGGRSYESRWGMSGGLETNCLASVGTGPGRVTPLSIEGAVWGEWTLGLKPVEMPIGCGGRLLMRNPSA